MFMPIEFPSAPRGALIAVVGTEASGIREFFESLGAPICGPGQEVTIPAQGTLVLDHALATRDTLTRTRIASELDTFKKSGGTIFLASHETALIEALADEVWWIDQGKLAAKGDPKEVLAKYRGHLANTIREWGSTVTPRLAPTFRRGDNRAEVIQIDTLGANGQPTIVWSSGEQVAVRATIRYHEAVSNPVLGMMLRTQIGFEVFGTNTELEQVPLGERAAGSTVAVTFAFKCELCPGAYTITVASHDPDGTAHDWLDDAVAIAVTDTRYTAGVANLRAKVTLS